MGLVVTRRGKFDGALLGHVGLFVWGEFGNMDTCVDELNITFFV